MSNPETAPAEVGYQRKEGGLNLTRRSYLWMLVFAAILLASAWITEFDLLALIAPEVRSQMTEFVLGGFPPDVSQEYLFGNSLRGGLLWATVETIAISILGMVIAFILALPMALLAASNVSYRGPLHAGSSDRTLRIVGRVMHTVSRTTLSFLRSVPGLVWGFLYVVAVGLGPFAGTLAIGTHNAGVLGKLYADFIEDTDPMKIEAVRSTGATRLQTIVHGIIPQVMATLTSYTLYRWECSMRAATILGFVGAGGIGYYLVVTITRLQYQKLVTAILAVFILVILTDQLSTKVRQALI